MYRAVVLTSLVILLLAVVGVSVAQESRTFVGGPKSDNPLGSTTPERTSIETTGPEETTPSPLPGVSSETGNREDASEQTVITEPTVEKPEKPTTTSVGEQTPTPGEPGNSGRGDGMPAHAGKTPNIGKPRVEVGRHGSGKAEERENEVERGRGAGREKVMLCHKGNRTLLVGAPALAGHLRHGDTRAGCQGEVSGPSGQTMVPEGAKNDGGDGREKVMLCHKNKSTLTVGAGVQAAHLRHGDSLGACS
jgi:hypothetical protein